MKAFILLVLQEKSLNSSSSTTSPSTPLPSTPSHRASISEDKTSSVVTATPTSDKTTEKPSTPVVSSAARSSGIGAKGIGLNLNAMLSRGPPTKKEDKERRMHTFCFLPFSPSVFGSIVLLLVFLFPQLSNTTSEPPFEVVADLPPENPSKRLPTSPR
jgi:hypothetical protein